MAEILFVIVVVVVIIREFQPPHGVFNPQQKVFSTPNADPQQSSLLSIY